MLATVLAFANSFSAPLVLDDYYSITENPTIRQLWPPGPAFSPPVKSGTGGRPVANFSYAVSYALSGPAPWGHHLVGVAVHALVALVLFGVVRRTLAQAALRERFGRDATMLAAVVALLWAVHPLQTQVVTYVSQRTESLMALFYLLTLYGFIRGAAEKSGRWFGLAVVACLLGMASKEVMVTAPVMVLLYDRTFVAGSFAEAWRRRWRLYAALAGTWLLLAWLLVGVHERDVGFGLGASVFDYVLTECKAVVLYLRLAFWPAPLIFDRGPILVKSLGEAAPWALVLAGLLSCTVVALRRRPVLGLAAAWYFIVLAPTSSFVPVVQQPIAENRPHLALVGVVALVVLGLYARVGRGGVAIGGALAAVCLVATLHRNRDYATELSIWEDTAVKAPASPRAHQNLGVALQKAGRTTEAIAAYRQSIELNPSYYPAHVSLGNALSEIGRDAEAIVHYRLGLQLEPRQPNACANLGIVLFRSGQREAGLEQFERAVAMDGTLSEARYNYGTALLQLGRNAEAIAQFRAVVTLDPRSAKGWGNLGLAVLQSGQPGEAIAHYERALQLDPGSVETHHNLANALGNAGRLAEAITHWEAALRLNPNFTLARDALARARELQRAPASKE